MRLTPWLRLFASRLQWFHRAGRRRQRGVGRSVRALHRDGRPLSFERLEDRTLLSGTVDLVSVADFDYDGLPTDAEIRALSADGNLLVFESAATNVVQGQVDFNSVSDLFVYNRSTGVVSLVSHTGDGHTTGNNTSYFGGISSDGSLIAYTSRATNLVTGQSDSNGYYDVFAYRVATGANVLVSHTGDGHTTGNSNSQFGGMSSDGSVIAYTSFATNLVAGQSDSNGNYDLFAYTVATQTNALVSHTGDGHTTGSGDSYFGGMSSDGSVIAYQSYATNLVTGQIDANGYLDVFAYTVATQTNALVSHTGDGHTTGNGTSYFGGISSDGSVIAYRSLATNLVTGQSDTNGDYDVFAYTVAAGTNALVSHTGDGHTTGSNASFFGGISSDGSVIAYHSTATNLVAGQVDTNGDYDVFAYTVAAGTNALVSHTGDGHTTGDGGSLFGGISSDGSVIAYSSYATNLVTGQVDSNGTDDLFAYTVAAGTNALVSHTGDGHTTGDGYSQFGGISSDGSVIAYTSYATNLVAGQVDTNGTDDLFAYTVATSANVLVSHTGDGLTTGDSSSQFGGISSDGSVIAYSSRATNLVAGFSPSPNVTHGYLSVAGASVLATPALGPLVAEVSANHESQVVGVSSNGRYVVFTSLATNLVAGQMDTNSTWDLFVLDRQTGLISLVSHTGDGHTTGDGYSYFSGISSDGSVIAYISVATNLVTGQSDTNGDWDVFAYTAATSANVLVSHTGDGHTTGNNGSSFGGISSDGSVIAYSSYATNLVTGQVDSNGTSDVFIYTVATQTNALVSHTGDGHTTANNGSSFGGISSDGSVIAYHSLATNLVAGQSDANNSQDVFAYTVAAGTSALVSHTGDGHTTANNYSDFGRISSDGSVIAYTSYATNLVAGQVDTNGTYDLFSYSVAAGTNALVSHTGDGHTTGNGTSSFGGISSDGSVIAYTSTATNLVAGQVDGNGQLDVFVYDVAAGTNALVSHTGDDKTTGNNSSYFGGISSDGSVIGFSSYASNLVNNDFNIVRDAFVWLENSAPVAQDDDLQTGEHTPLSGDLFADNGHGIDSDPNGDAFVVSAVNGSALYVGTQITLASGALLTVNADGSYTYNPNGAFETLNFGQSTTDTFTYTVQDPGGLESTATVTVTITGANDGFTYSGSTVLVAGTSGDDTVLVDLATGVITLNGVAHQLPETITHVVLNGLGGYDRLFLEGTAGSEVVRLTPQRGVLESSSIGVTGVAHSFELMVFTSHGGNDSVTFIDSAGDDTFYSRPAIARMVGPGYENRAVGVGNVVAISNVGGYDRAYLYDSAGDDLFVSTINQATMSGTGTSARQFEQTVAIAENGGHDRANLYDTAGDDLFTASAAMARMDGTNTTAHGFEVVQGLATSGGYDRAILTGTAGNDVLRSEGTQTTLVLAGAGVAHAVQFEQVVVHGNGGRDVAHLAGSAGVDNLLATQTQAQFRGEGYHVLANQFALVNATGIGAGDIAILRDSPGDDVFIGDGASARLVGEQAVYNALDFATVTIQGSTGLNRRKLLSPLIYTLNQQGNWV